MAYSKAVGVVREQRGDSSAGIEVLALKNGKEYIQDEETIKRVCPPIGYVFAPSFYKRTNLEARAFEFGYKENTTPTDERDYKMIIDYDSKLQNVGYEVLNSKVDIAAKDSIDFQLLQSFKPTNTNKFYIRFEDKIYGSFKIKNEQIIPNTGKEIKCWVNPNLKKINWEQREFILEEPKGESQLIDCMTPDQLAKWFQNELKKIDNPLIKTLKSNVNWKNILNELFSNKTEESLIKARFFKAIKSLSDIESSYRQLLELAEQSYIFKDLYQAKMDLFRKEMEVEFEKERKTLEEKLAILEENILFKGRNLTLIEESKEELEKELDYLKTNEEEIVRNLRIFSKIAPPNISNSSPNTSPLKSYLVEQTTHNKDASPFKNKDEFLQNLKSYLHRYKIYSRRIELRIFENLANYKCFFVPNMYFAIAIVTATNNCTYIIQQAEADWLKFENFWKNGLGEIWELSHKNPQTLHFLILQNINLASPDCYARPLLDVNAGIRNRLPFSNSEFPKNLRIIATRLPSEPPEAIGLPLFKRSFEKWGAIQIEEKENSEDSNALKKSENYLDFPQLEEWNNLSEEDLEWKFEEALNQYFDNE